METNSKIPWLATILQLFLVLIIIPLLPILISWRWNWWEAWIYALSLFLGFVISRALAARRHPGLLAERAGSLQKKDAKPWDKVLAPTLALGGMVVPIIAGLEEHFQWSPEPFSLPIKLAAIISLVLGYAFSSWAMVENAYFSGVVRLQADRGHEVCTSGPYRWVRHPGYAGGLLAYIAMPFLLDTVWSFIPVVILSAVTILRTLLEDRTLQEELSGYREYARDVKYRLIPGIW
jgi:protein-S-isoprenylcysteine O-methyltransferase Ste14